MNQHISTYINTSPHKEFGNEYDSEFKGIATHNDFHRVIILLQKFADKGISIESLMKWLAYKHKPYKTIGNHAPDDSIIEVIKAFNLCNILKIRRSIKLRQVYRNSLLKHIHYKKSMITKHKSS